MIKPIIMLNTNVLDLPKLGYNIAFTLGCEYFNSLNIGDFFYLGNNKLQQIGDIQQVKTLVTIPFWKVRETEVAANCLNLARDELESYLRNSSPKVNTYNQVIITMIGFYYNR
ncbi:MAG: hypothetical protein R3321_00075 [Nitrososphaeraceae archaeon]|nr:hypothetical protein [Nitrososphaeraceae archaeon]